MAVKQRDTLKKAFKTGSYPTEKDFADALDSFVHKEEDKLPISAIEGLTDQINGKFDSAAGEGIAQAQTQLREDFDTLEQETNEKVEDLRDQDDIHKENIAKLLRMLHPDVEVSTDNIAETFAALGVGYSTVWNLANTLKTFLEDNDVSDSAINKWQEIEAFLAGITDQQTLTGMLESLNTTLTEAINTEKTRAQGKEGELLTAINTEKSRAEAAEASLSQDMEIAPITWAALKALRDAGTLKPGKQYRITDYQCTTTQSDTRSAGHMFDIIVTADATNVLNENARAIQHDGDTHFADADLAAWKIKYCLDNDTTRFAWADAVNGKGVVWYLKDEFNNECSYDFKNIQFKRFKATLKSSLGILSESVFEYISECGGNWYDILSGKFNLDRSDYIWCYTFHDWANSNTDGSLNQASGEGYDAGDSKRGVYSNSIKENHIAVSIDDGDLHFVLALNNIVFYTTIPMDEQDTENLITCGNVFGVDCENMTFSRKCYFNTFGDGCFQFSFGNSCSYNRFGTGCNGNIFGNGCDTNTFGNGCYWNNFGNNCYSNQFGNNCYSNQFGNDCSSNNFGNYCNSNQFGNDCGRNTFGNSVTVCRLGVDNGYFRYITISNGVTYTDITCSSAGNANSYAQNVMIYSGIAGTSSSRKAIAIPSRNGSLLEVRPTTKNAITV